MCLIQKLFTRDVSGPNKAFLTVNRTFRLRVPPETRRPMGFPVRMLDTPFPKRIATFPDIMSHSWVDPGVETVETIPSFVALDLYDV